ncbi:hypothetical protein C8Q77DRAFT_1207814 [Trametes polyzona]|nr:hypothetical protein C8Q77DRAFT_1207814 [Trametes polyzona]
MAHPESSTLRALLSDLLPRANQHRYHTSITMAAYYPTTTLARSASTLAGPVLTAKRSRNLVSFAPSPSLLPSPSLITFSSDYRPNKAELEARLAGAHVRANSRRLRDALGHERSPSTTPTTTSAAPRTTRAAAFTIPSGDAYTPTTTTTTTTALLPASPLSRVAYPEAGPTTIYTTTPLFQSAPSPSMLPPPPATPRPFFPRRRSRAPVRGSALVGLGLSAGAPPSFPEFVEADAPLTPHHVYPDTLRRTPGAPLRAERAGDSDYAGEGASYFHLPADIISPQLSAGGMARAVGLGIVGVDL